MISSRQEAIKKTPPGTHAAAAILLARASLTTWQAARRVDGCSRSRMPLIIPAAKTRLLPYADQEWWSAIRRNLSFSSNVRTLSLRLQPSSHHLTSGSPAIDFGTLQIYEVID